MLGKFLTRSENETINLGREFSKVLKAGDVVALYGELGSGKTRFIQGVCKGLGVSEVVNSPTFIIMNRYEGRLKVYHFDFYRIDEVDEIIEIGFNEFIYNDAVSLIEWAEKVGEILPDSRYEVVLNFGSNENERIIEISKL
ncbi:tRNA threonylcarbamoyladenosine biosynthesis protein TsaE [Candidatus Kryptonium thompsonii]|uniref:tRNA threonylcarbamoyladenosine biosynthesis protein TsaE n=1 Tax=Candidatus Kryptonium thompsonii TaxID=1633631 RepID=A0A0P1N0N3_9BACT|nr:tRNA (adenosine(37)-N6)-threonylcarbamoyltransferase complex ATPase subunit type 1 TsaE [Candidatus Kryptonium thompsoni]CUS76502.1 tRNA threonylcarbamoyladenosine biosynthesis protein TsaE [Candidatus Kryptonium thompsoni]CUS76563.1 tRNA threonylcarbamoyladenosine biosynthesis protein TsaE [Candidatus Kryptonium thompsoni]CUS76648.1 tRNA threonylcarbamoyladenosine biosynthesis protein TsaE [Candidatus Kryptonium thompsoni]CUS80530.1 tRNA threonylcarbamoyladenosine biosynthesis protein TsaE 